MATPVVVKCRKCGAWMNEHPSGLCYTHRRAAAERARTRASRQASREDRLYNAARRAYDSDRDIPGEW
jgi:hypothetical protein